MSLEKYYYLLPVVMLWLYTVVWLETIKCIQDTRKKTPSVTNTPYERSSGTYLLTIAEKANSLVLYHSGIIFYSV